MPSATSAAIGMLIFLALTIPPAKSAEPLEKPQIPIITAYKDGKAQAAMVLDIEDSMDACKAALATWSVTNHPKAGVTLRTGCIEVPPLPTTAT